MSSNGTGKSVITCPHCKQRFSVKMPKATIFNDLTVSIVSATHEKPVRCICGKFSVIGIQVAEMAWTVIPITDEQANSLNESKIIVPPPPGISLLR